MAADSPCLLRPRNLGALGPICMTRFEAHTWNPSYLKNLRQSDKWACYLCFANLPSTLSRLPTSASSVSRSHLVFHPSCYLQPAHTRTQNRPNPTLYIENFHFKSFLYFLSYEVFLFTFKILCAKNNDTISYPFKAQWFLFVPSTTYF
jgi:hypothetical protein